MKTLFLILILQVTQPQYEFKSTSVYLEVTQTSQNYQDNSFYRPGPKKVSGVGWLDWYVWGRNHGVPSSASNDEMYAYYQYIQNGGSLTYNEWYNNINKTPIGEPIIPILMLTFPYILYKFKKLKNKSEFSVYINK